MTFSGRTLENQTGKVGIFAVEESPSNEKFHQIDSEFDHPLDFFSSVLFVIDSKISFKFLVLNGSFYSRKITYLLTDIPPPPFQAA